MFTANIKRCVFRTEPWKRASPSSQWKAIKATRQRNPNSKVAYLAQSMFSRIAESAYLPPIRERNTFAQANNARTALLRHVAAEE